MLQEIPQEMQPQAQQKQVKQQRARRTGGAAQKQKRSQRSTTVTTRSTTTAKQTKTSAAKNKTLKNKKDLQEEEESKIRGNENENEHEEDDSEVVFVKARYVTQQSQAQASVQHAAVEQLSQAPEQNQTNEMQLLQPSKVPQMTKVVQNKRKRKHLLAQNKNDIEAGNDNGFAPAIKKEKTMQSQKQPKKMESKNSERKKCIKKVRFTDMEQIEPMTANMNNQEQQYQQLELQPQDTPTPSATTMISTILPVENNHHEQEPPHMERKRDLKSTNKWSNFLEKRLGNDLARKLVQEKHQDEQIETLSAENAELKRKLAEQEAELRQETKKRQGVQEKLSQMTERDEANRQEFKARERKLDQDISYYREKARNMLEPIKFPQANARVEDFKVVQESNLSRTERSEIRDIIKQKIRSANSAANLAHSVKSALMSQIKMRNPWQVFVSRYFESYFVYQDKHKQSYINFCYKDFLEIRIQNIH